MFIMQLSIPIQSEFFQMHSTAPTVIEPGQKMLVQLELTAQTQLTIGQVLWEIPEGLLLQAGDPATDFPITLEAGSTWTFEQSFAPEEESFGLLGGKLVFHPGDTSEVVEIDWEHWISIFKKVEAPETEFLSDELRDRLIGITNARPQNGHIFLADHVRYFADYLHILITERMAKILAAEFALSDEGLPVDFEQYILFCQGLRTFYGIEVLELIAEEECNESDDRFDPEAIQEALPGEVEIG